MFTRSMMVACLTFGLCAAGLWHKAFYLTDSDRTRFEAMIAKAQDECEPTTPLTSQMKHGVKKEIYQTREGARYHTVIACESAELCAVPIGDSYELIEKMFSIDGLVQESPDQIRTFRSKKGTLFYNTHQFISDMVAMKIEQGCDTDFKGFAKDLTLIVDADNTRMTSSQMRAHISDLEELSKCY